MKNIANIPNKSTTEYKLKNKLKVGIDGKKIYTIYRASRFKSYRELPF